MYKFCLDCGSEQGEAVRLDDPVDMPGVTYLLFCAYCYAIAIKVDGRVRLLEIKEYESFIDSKTLSKIRYMQRRQRKGLPAISRQSREQSGWSRESRHYCCACGDHFKTSQMRAEHCFFEASSLQHPGFRSHALLVPVPECVPFHEMVETTFSYMIPSGY
jgi:hypothetical protein